MRAAKRRPSFPANPFCPGAVPAAVAVVWRVQASGFAPGAAGPRLAPVRPERRA